MLVLNVFKDCFFLHINYNYSLTMLSVWKCMNIIMKTRLTQLCSIISFSTQLTNWPKHRHEYHKSLGVRRVLHIIILPNHWSINLFIFTLQYKFLPYPHLAYGTEYCVENEWYKSHSHDDFGYKSYNGYTRCLADCRLRYLVEKCRCRGLTFPGNPIVEFN